MGARSRSVFLASLVPAVLLGGVFAVVQAQNAGAPARATKWSDPATWPNNKVPAAGDKVAIAKDKNVILDVNTPALGGVTIDGKLSFADNADVELTTEWIMLHGELAIGTEAKPHARKATITFTDNVKGENIMAGMGDRGIMISGGTLNLHGDRTHTWSKLSATGNAGATSIQVLDAKGWKVGDEIVLASTDFDPRQAERRTIAAIRGNNITLDKKLDYMHFGKITFDVDQRGEVGLLTRNIKIQASEDAAQSYFGGHIMAMPSSKMFVSGVELNRMGQHMTLARYPIHWHLVGDAKGQYIKNASIHDTYSRCVTVHGTNFLRVENNVTYNIVGHCFFLEDGIEHSNEFVRNLAIQIKCHPTKKCVPTNLAANGEISENRQTIRQASIPARTPCCLRTTRWRLTGSPIRTIHSSAMWPRAPTRMASGSRCRSTRTVSSWTRKSARAPGRDAPSSASSGTTLPTRTSTGSCSTGTSMWKTSSGWPAPRTCPRKTLLTRTARAWTRSSRISPPTRTAMAASGAEANGTSSGT